MLPACETIALAVSVAMGFSAISFGQAGSATVSGKVTDPSGLVVVGANVEATNIGTNDLRSIHATTRSRGFPSQQNG